MDTLLHELRYSLRMFRKSPAFSAIAVLTLALGIGASTAIFSVVDAVLLRPLPYPKPEQVVRVWEQAPDGHRMNLADRNFRDFQTDNNSFAALAEYTEVSTSASGGSEPVRIDLAAVSSGFFKALGAEPFLGRSFAADEQRLHGAPAVIVSYKYWKRYLGGVEDFSNVKLTMQGGVYPVIGVMPAGFDFPSGVSGWTSLQLHEQPSSRTAHNYRGLGRIRDGVSLTQARANLGTIAQRLKQQYGKQVDLNNVAVVPLADAMVGDVRTSILTLLGAVGLLLLVACANVAGLFLARASARRKELAVRAALGAERGRIILQFLAESFTLSLLGGSLGFVMAAAVIMILPAIVPSNLPHQHEISLNVAVLLFAMAATVVVAFSLGLFAAWRAGSGDLQEALGTGSRNYTGSGATQKVRSLLVSGEIALALMILVVAGLLGRSFLRLISTNPGFRADNLITIEFFPPVSQEQNSDEMEISRQIQRMDAILDRLRTIPGTEYVGLAGAFPVARGDNLADGDFLLLNGQQAPANFDDWSKISQNPSQVGHAYYCVAGEGYFRAMGIPIIRGRIFHDQDGLNSPHVAVISETLALQRWPNQNPIGQTIDFGNMDGNLKPLTIVGVVGDVRGRGLDFPPIPIIYVDFRQRGLNMNSSPTIVMRDAAHPADVSSAARIAFQQLAPDVPLKISTFAEEMGGWLADRRFLLLLLGTFASVALVLAAVGIYGVVAFSVSRRTQEIGVRMALGAQRGTILRMVLGEGARMAAIGVVIGIAASLAMTRVLSSLLFGIEATDPLTFAAVAVLLILVALAASHIPARRAMRLDPNTALRYE